MSLVILLAQFGLVGLSRVSRLSKVTAEIRDSVRITVSLVSAVMESG